MLTRQNGLDCLVVVVVILCGKKYHTQNLDTKDKKEFNGALSIEYSTRAYVRAKAGNIVAGESPVLIIAWLAGRQATITNGKFAMTGFACHNRNKVQRERERDDIKRNCMHGFF